MSSLVVTDDARTTVVSCGCFGVCTCSGKLRTETPQAPCECTLLVLGYDTGADLGDLDGLRSSMFVIVAH